MIKRKALTGIRVSTVADMVCSGLLGSLCMLVPPADAALIERDWQISGDAALTYDTATGLEWLDLTVTAGMSYNEVAAELEGGGAYDGFAFASEQQVTELFNSADLQELPLGKSGEGPKIQALLQLWGVLWDLGSGERSEFITANTDGLDSGEHWTGRLVWTELGDTGVSARISVRNDDYKNVTIGSGLARPVLPLTLNGDVNRDGGTDLGDAVLLMRVILGRSIGAGVDPGHADYYPPGAPDGVINMSDMMIMLRNLF